MSFLRKLLKKSARCNTDRGFVQEKSFKNKELGDRGEAIACDFLTERGFRILECNFSGAGGEIDIVAEREGEIHFIEVKTRSHESHGSPLESVTERKQDRIRRAARLWLEIPRKNFNSDELPPCYFSVIGIDFAGEWPDIEFLEDAFV
jgi:putative endonuclease